MAWVVLWALGIPFHLDPTRKMEWNRRLLSAPRRGRFWGPLD